MTIEEEYQDTRKESKSLYGRARKVMPVELNMTPG